MFQRLGLIILMLLYDYVVCMAITENITDVLICLCIVILKKPDIPVFEKG